MLAALCALLVLPSLGAGWLLDDYQHQNVLAGRIETHAPASPYGLFAFIDGEPARVRAMVDAGVLPWWTLDDLRIRFWRPLTELTHALDHALAPREPVLAHAHNLLWGAALVWLATLLYREVQGVVLAAGFAAIAFAVDDGHVFPLVWVANRNTVIAATLAVAALLLHVRWRRRAWVAGALLGPAAFLAALLAAEAALAILAYFVAYHAVYPTALSARRPREAAGRIPPLLPYAAIALAYLVAYRALGYGVHGSGQYLDPLGQPGTYLVEALPRAVLLLAGQLATVPLMLESFHYRGEAGRAVSIALAALFVFVVVRNLILPRWDRPAMRFWATGMLLCLPSALVLGSFTRALVFAGIGGAGMLGIVFADWYESVGLRTDLWGTLGRRTLVAMHLVVAPLALLVLSVGLPRVLDHGERALDRLPGSENATWVLVNPRAAFWAGVVPGSRLHEGRPVPRMRALASGAFGVALERESERCLEVTPARGYLFLTADRLFRDPAEVMPVGWRRHLPDLTVEVVEALPDGRPRTARFCFDRPLEDPSLWWVAYVGAGPQRFRAPAIGESVVLGPVF